MTTTPSSRPSADLPLAVVGLVLLVLGAALTTFVGVMLAFVSDSCGVNTCNTGLIGAGMVTTAGGPWAVVLATGVGVLVQARRRRRLAPVVGLGLLIALLVAAAGVALAFGGGPH